jgi:hypothetical protein
MSSLAAEYMIRGYCTLSFSFCVTDCDYRSVHSTQNKSEKEQYIHYKIKIDKLRHSALYTPHCQILIDQYIIPLQ